MQQNSQKSKSKVRLKVAFMRYHVSIRFLAALSYWNFKHYVAKLVIIASILASFWKILTYKFKKMCVIFYWESEIIWVQKTNLNLLGNETIIFYLYLYWCLISKNNCSN